MFDMKEAFSLQDADPAWHQARPRSDHMNLSRGRSRDISEEKQNIFYPQRRPLFLANSISPKNPLISTPIKQLSIN